jgi:hypothetical protein
MPFFLVTEAEHVVTAWPRQPYEAKDEAEAIEKFCDDCLCADERDDAKFAVFTISEPVFYSIEVTTTLKPIKKPTSKSRKKV